jgi:hypothetical protein
VTPDTSARDHRPVRFPDGTPAIIGTSLTVTEWRGADCTLNCRPCFDAGDNREFIVRCGGQDTVLPEYVKEIARHLWLHHNLPVIAAAERRG